MRWRILTLVTSVLRAAWVPLALLSSACAGGCDDGRPQPSAWGDPLPSDPIARALALRDKVPTAVAKYPDGTVMLAQDHAFDLVVLRGDDLFGAAGDELVRLPKAGGATTTLATFPGRETRAIALTAKHVVVATHERDPGGVGVKDGTGKVVAVSIDGGAPVELAHGFSASTEMTAGDDGVYLARDTTPPVVWFYPAPAFNKPVRISERPHVMFWGMLAVRDGVVWIEDDFSDKPKTLLGWTRTDGGGAVRELGHTGGYGSSMRGDGHTVYLVTTSTRSAVAPGGGTYYEETGSVVVIDLATGVGRPVTTGLDNPGDLALGTDAICVTAYGPKLEFSKNGTVLAVPKSGGDARPLATGLQRPRCLVADESSFYVVEQGKKGIARVPVN